MLEDSDDDLPETEYVLGQVLTTESGPLFYEYDFGDGWIHPLDSPGASPPRQRPAGTARGRGTPGTIGDSGGIGRYLDLLDALADPGHEEHEDLQTWVAWTVGQWQGFDPEQLDIAAVNNELALLVPTESTDEPGPGSESFIQELTRRLPGIRRAFRSNLATAGPSTHRRPGCRC